MRIVPNEISFFYTTTIDRYGSFLYLSTYEEPALLSFMDYDMEIKIFKSDMYTGDQTEFIYDAMNESISIYSLSGKRLK